MESGKEAIMLHGMLHRFELDEGFVATTVLATLLAAMTAAAFLLMYLPLTGP
jgi:hypothetical protein